MDRLRDKVSETLKFLTSLRNTHWGPTPNEKTIDSSFKSALELEETFLQEENNSDVQEFLKCCPSLNLKKPVDVLMLNILQNHHLDEHLILYAINKYILLYSKSDFSKLLDRTMSEIELRCQIFKLIEEFPDVDLDFYRLNNFLCDLLSSSDLRSQVLHSLKNQTSVFLKAILHSTAFNVQIMVEEVIGCLESQTDLKLWFMIMKDENLDTVMELCAQHADFLQAVFKFFDKFAHETETNYDEELNVIYSHVNLDFEDFVRILQLFLKKNSISKAIKDYLDSKTLKDKNFCFWVDVNACLQ